VLKPNNRTYNALSMNPTAQLSVYKYLAVVQICTKAPRGNEAKLLLMEPIVTTEGKDCYSFPNNRWAPWGLLVSI